MKNILYITYDGLTDPLGQSQVLPYLVNLSKEGYRFTILSFEKGERYKKERTVIEDIVKRAGIRWVPIFFTARPPVLSKIWDRFRMGQTAGALHRQHTFDLIHCRSYVAAEIGLQLKHRYGLRMVFDMRGFWADEKVDNGQWDLAKPLYKKIYNHYKKKEKAFLLAADGIVSLTHVAKHHLLEKKEYAHLSITVIPTCADLDHFDYHTIEPARQKHLRTALGLQEKDKILLYLGSVGGWYLTEEMFRLFKILQNNDSAYKMLVLTKDNPKKILAEALTAGIPEAIITVAYADRQQLPLYLSLCTLSVFFIRNTFSKIASSPTKLAELMGMGIPVICNDIGDTGQIIRETKTGVVIDDFGIESLQQVVKKFPEIENIDKLFIRQWAKKYFDLGAGTEKYLGLYEKILRQKGE